MKKISKLIAFALLPVLTLTGCDSNDSPNPDVDIFSVFATFASSSDKGSMFTTREKDDSELITLTTTREIDTKSVPVGQRYIISYSNSANKPFVSGPIDLWAIQAVANGDVQTASAAEIKQLTSDPITVKAIQRSGTYIDVQCSAPISQQAKVFGLYADEASLSTESAQLYLAFQTDIQGASDKQFFGSFDIATIYNNPAYKEIAIHYNNNQKTFVISKGAISIKPTE